ncbi:Thiol:disulfide interchange protein TlpA [Aquimixticola soesokkakensis]|uniref:Thiol:disulfide interchange protein TlpA n=1 Tax=Aquimixticola soesokkakensis TaxID=1519096 RepID=A0A1Y5SZD0_9RHOB|nr:TlpA disulfide reductase family protein [Aquimixticola soesokkakensis]SLN48583.1 Thiol:disulfide interchange protein TlpA [Aquimixticola soesokkakensis]
MIRNFTVALLYTALSLTANVAHAQTAPLPAAQIETLRVGEMRKLSFLETPKAVPDLSFTDPDGTERFLSDYAGKVVVLNFWATWCAPCRKEMPTFDALAREMGAEVAVVPIATGRNALPAITRFFEETGVETLPVLLDPKGQLARSMAVLGLPATLLIDAQGYEVARMTGEADWNAPHARAVINALVAQGAQSNAAEP